VRYARPVLLDFIERCVTTELLALQDRAAGCDDRGDESDRVDDDSVRLRGR
jgi:hypothetical protein